MLLDLIRGLGIKATLRSGDATITENDPLSPGDKRRRVTGTRWRITFTTSTQVFRLPWKADKVPASVRSTQDWLHITDVVPAGSGGGRCLTVDNDEHVFLCAGFVPTHNTTTSTNFAGLCAAAGWHTLFIEFDPQGDAGDDLGYKRREDTDQGAHDARGARRAQAAAAGSARGPSESRRHPDGAYGAQAHRGDRRG